MFAFICGESIHLPCRPYRCYNPFHLYVVHTFMIWPSENELLNVPKLCLPHIDGLVKIRTWHLSYRSTLEQEPKGEIIMPFFHLLILLIDSLLSILEVKSQLGCNSLARTMLTLKDTTEPWGWEKFLLPLNFSEALHKWKKQTYATFSQHHLIFTLSSQNYKYYHDFLHYFFFFCAIALFTF